VIAHTAETFVSAHPGKICDFLAFGNFCCIDGIIFYFIDLLLLMLQQLCLLSDEKK